MFTIKCITPMLKYILNIFQLVISPAHGWEDISSSGVSAERLVKKGFYPLLACLAISALIPILYKSAHISLIEGLQHAIIAFTVFFATLFLGNWAMANFMPAMSETANTRLKNQSYVIYSLGFLAIIDIVNNVLPVDVLPIQILPAYVLFIMYKGVRYLDVAPSKIGQFMFVSVLFIALPPFALSFILKMIIPQV